MTSLWRHSRLTYYDLGPIFLTQGVELFPGEVWLVSKRNSQYFRSYLRKTTREGLWAPPAGRGLTVARIRCFATFGRHRGGGGWCDPPWRFPTKRRRASRNRPSECSRRLLAIGGIIFGPRSIFDPVIAGQVSNFRKLYDFPTLRVHISKTIYRTGRGPSPACSPFNSVQNEVFWCISVEYLGRIVLINDAVFHRWRHRPDLWPHRSVTWHGHMIGISTMET